MPYAPDRDDQRAGIDTSMASVLYGVPDYDRAALTYDPARQK